LIFGRALAAIYYRNFAQAQLRLTKTAMGYAERALCLREARLCQARQLPFNDYQQRLQELQPDSLASLYALAVGWACCLNRVNGEPATSPATPR
jgi:hypothetical protein